MFPLRPNSCRPRTAAELIGVLAVSLVAAAVLRLVACGPFLPNSLLTQGDDAVLRAPEVSFRRELDRLAWPPPPGLVHVPATSSLRDQTVTEDQRDLARSLQAGGGGVRSSNEVHRLLHAYSAGRAAVETHRLALEQHEHEREDPRDGAWGASAAPERPVMPSLDLPEDLPAEFAAYLRGAAAWHDHRVEDARAAWRGVLELPRGQRAYRSTWASYMLGRSWHEEDPVRAASYYAQTRRGAREGLADHASLAVASLGWEGQLRLRTNDLAGALAFYLDQYAAGAKESAGPSLRRVARRVLEAPMEQRLAVARVPALRRVVTAWLLAHGDGRDEVLQGWLDALEETGAAEEPLAEQLALLGYQGGRWDEARRWAVLAGESAVGQWVLAKLLLREGELQAAAEVLSRIVNRLEVDATDGAATPSSDFLDSLSLPEEAVDPVPGRHHLRGELGVVHLTRGEFEQALDALLRGGFWQDAAYVAERLLSLEELKTYVDREWPEGPRPSGAAETSGPAGDTDARAPGERLRHLLARRLTRADRGAEAGPYYPPPWREPHARLIHLLALGQDVSRPLAERADAYAAAARRMRADGMHLLGTEGEPDWVVWEGDYEHGPTPAERARSGSRSRVLTVSAEETRRVRGAPAEPNRRFHYRYQAARLAWEAAGWMPDNDPATARLLYDAGSWLKFRDPATADLFYKALVRRCRQTALGEAADRQRWFPPLDPQGQPVVTREPEVAVPAPGVP